MTENKEMEILCLKDLMDKFVHQEITQQHSKPVYDNFIKSQLDLWVDRPNKEKKLYRNSMYKTIVKFKFEYIKGLEQLMKTLGIEMKNIIENEEPSTNTKSRLLGFLEVCMNCQKDKHHNSQFVLKMIKNKEYSPFIDNNFVKEALYHNEKIDEKYYISMCNLKNDIIEEIKDYHLEFVSGDTSNSAGSCCNCCNSDSDE